MRRLLAAVVGLLFPALAYAQLPSIQIGATPVIQGTPGDALTVGGNNRLSQTPIGTAAGKNLGTSVTDPGTGALEMVLPSTTTTGASKVYGASDLFKKFRRSNSGSVMTDTLPAAGTTGLVNGTRINIANVETTTYATTTPATVTISAGAGTTISGASSYVLQPERDVDFVYDVASTAWRANVNTASGQIKIAALPYEMGVVNDNWPPGHAFRYGISCDGTTDYENIGLMNVWQANSLLPGVTGYLPACYYATGVNYRAVFSNSNVYVQPGMRIPGVWHQIANGSTGQPPGGTCTISAGTVNAYALKNSTVTITIASPGVITWNSNGLANGATIALTNSGGALPSPFVAGRNYYVVNAATNTFQLSASLGGAAINTSGSQSGTQTATMHGTGYFNAATATATAAGGGNTLRGVSVGVLMEADFVDMITTPGSGYAVNDTITWQNSVVGTVSAVSATGGVTGINVTTRGSMADPTANTYGNRYTQVSTSGAGSGFSGLVAFRVASVTLNSGGTGGAALSCTAAISGPTLNNVRAYGQITSGGRLGIQGTVDNYVQAFHGLDDAATYGSRNPGSHIDGNLGLLIDDIEIDGCAIGAGTVGWACVAIESNGGSATRASRIKRIWVKKADNHGVALCSEMMIDEIRVEAYGQGASDATTTAYCGPQASGIAAGFFAYRATGYIGYVRIRQNDQLIGALAKYGVLVASTGIAGASGYAPTDNLFPLVSTGGWGLMFGDVFVDNASRRGGFVLGDVDNPDSGAAGLSVSAGRVQVAASASIAMSSSSYQLVTVNAPGSTGVDSLSEFFANSVVLLNTGVSNGVAISPQPDAFKCASGSVVRIGLLRIPNHGAGNTGLVQGQCQFATRISMDQTTNIGLVAGSNAFLQFSGAGTTGSDVWVTANSGGGNPNQPFATFANTANLTFGGNFTSYRNALLATSGTNNDLRFVNLWASGVNSASGAIVYGGTLNRHVLRDFYGTGWTIALSPLSTPTCNSCIADNINYGTNSTDSTLAAGFWSNGLNNSGLATATRMQIDTGTKTASATAGAATLNKSSGTITSEALTTAAGATYTLTLSNTTIAAGDIVNAQLYFGTATQGQPSVLTVTPGANQVVIVVKNVDAAAAFDGTIKIAFQVLKN